MYFTHTSYLPVVHIMTLVSKLGAVQGNYQECMFSCSNSATMGYLYTHIYIPQLLVVSNGGQYLY